MTILEGGLFNTKVCAAKDVPEYTARFFSFSITNSQRTVPLLAPIFIDRGRGEVKITTQFGVSASANPTIVPVGGSTQLSAVTGAGTPGSIQWTANPTDNSISNTSSANPTASPRQSTDYTVTTTDTRSTTVSDSVRVCVSDLTLNLSAVPNPISVGESTQLDAAITGGVGTPRISWSPGFRLSDPSISNPIASPRSTTQFSATVVDDEGCPLTDTISVNVISPLTPSVTASPGTINIGGTSQLSVSVSGGAPPYTYTWNPVRRADGTLILNGPVDSPLAYPTESTVFTLTARDANGATATTAATVHIAMGINVSAFPSGPVPPSTIVTLEPTVTGGLPPYSYVWAPTLGLNPADGFLRSPRVAPRPGNTTYTVNVTDALGQTVQGNVTVAVTGGAPQPTADLTMSKTAPPGALQRGGSIDFLLSVFNNGPSEATGTTIRDTLPAHLSFQSGPSSPNCSASGQVVTCDLGTIPANVGEVGIVFAFVDQCAPAGTVTNTAIAGSIEDDPLPADNSSSVTLNVDVPPISGNADLEVTDLTGPSAPVSPGELIFFNVQLDNNGPDDSHATVLVDNVHPYLVFEPQFSTCGPRGGVPSCCFGTLSPSAGATVTLYYQVHPSTPSGPIEYSVTVQGDQDDPNPSNDSKTLTVTVQ